MTPERWRKIEQAFLAVESVEPERREQILRSECAGDADLRQEVESLLACRTGGDAHLKNVIGAAADAFQAEIYPSAEGRRIGPYHVLRVIGQGGMGAVYLAVRADDQFEQQVAIKIVSQGLIGESDLARFRHERQLLANLQHPNIARLLDGGATVEGLPYFAMEYLEGKTIGEYCSDRRLTIRERLKLFVQVCSAVEYAHQKLVVHRDIKPGNILVTPDGIPKLLDFGIAKLLDPGNAEKTRTLAALMTPYYASPEQMRGEEVTTATDIYSLGALLYELLTDRRPYEFPSQGFAQIERIVCEQEPRLPSQLAPRNVARELAGDLDNIVLRAMQKQPERRYPSVERLADDIGRYLNGLPVQAQKNSLRYRAGKFLRRHALAVTAAALILCLAIAATATFLYEAHIAQRRFSQLRHLANSFLFDFHDEISGIAGATKARAMVVKTALEYLDQLSRESGGDRALLRELASAYRKVGEIQGDPQAANLGDQAGARASYRKAIGILTKLPDASQVRGDLVRAYGSLGRLEVETAPIAEALATLGKGRALAETESAAHPADLDLRLELGAIYLGMGRVDLRASDVPGALEAARKARGVFEAAPQNAALRSGLATAYSELGLVEAAQGNLAGAMESYRRSLAIRLKITAEEPANAGFQRDLMVSYSHIGDLEGSPSLPNLGDPAAAAATYRQVLAIAERLSAADPNDKNARWDVATSCMRLGDILVAARAPVEALQRLLQALAIGEALSGLERDSARLSRNSLYANQRIGSLLAEAGDGPAAKKAYQRAITDGARLVAVDPKNANDRAGLLRAHRGYGRFLAKSGDRAAVDTSVQAMARLAESLVSPNAPMRRLVLRPQAYSDIAGMYEQLRDLPAARPWLQKSLDAWKDLATRGPADSSYGKETAAVAARLAKFPK